MAKRLRKTRLKDRLYEDATFVQAETQKKKRCWEREKTAYTFIHQIFVVGSLLCSESGHFLNEQTWAICVLDLTIKIIIGVLLEIATRSTTGLAATATSRSSGEPNENNI